MELVLNRSVQLLVMFGPIAVMTLVSGRLRRLFHRFVDVRRRFSRETLVLGAGINTLVAGGLLWRFGQGPSVITVAILVSLVVFGWFAFRVLADRPGQTKFWDDDDLAGLFASLGIAVGFSWVCSFELTPYPGLDAFISALIFVICCFSLHKLD